MRRFKFYEKIINKYLKKKFRILVVGAGKTDVQLFKNYKNVIFSNISKKTELNKIIKKILMQDLPYSDQEFDYVVTHASIHHCSKPHLAVLEMLRVAKIGVIFIESRDCLITRLSCKIGLSEEYEFSAVNNNTGGVDDTGVPNFVYRWTEREVFKLLNSYKPLNKYKTYFDYDYDFKFLKNRLVNIFLYIFFFIFRNQKNLMSVFIKKK
jgi:SAM-dependent methyltransferase